ncbi:ORF6N domain-containing protein [Halobacteriovorax sp. JY17]|uniref:ORF6N domain-containing protein n=1 Tax=Halobacteriovorax sp. JY17 TaxID=2014617 RepID=UPI000C69CAF4|nr:ORF6N domain-containing protein [Halobacteriovorax sp. JY17]PIK14795.1 MAG: DNA-binding protein [Halobacteriovorax sp. JY17]
MDFPIDQIQNMIYEIRGQRVILDSDLAKLYGVETKRLNEQVRRNIERFPEDFMLECNSDDLDVLRSQFATSNNINSWSYKRRSKPMMFTENGVAMLSTVLNSKQAIQVNIAIMRTFTKLRSFLAMENSVEGRVDKLEQGTHKLFKIVFERLDDIEVQISPKLAPNRRKIGLKK